MIKLIIKNGAAWIASFALLITALEWIVNRIAPEEEMTVISEEIQAPTSAGGGEDWLLFILLAMAAALSVVSMTVLVSLWDRAQEMMLDELKRQKK